ncbi:MAG: hemerythrin domain-containing protein [Rhodobacterales bacterium]|nr:hemerythrin domain-containing protein [Rhodobacterales bacterium]
MMTAFSLRIVQTLHEDHMATMALLERLEGTLRRLGSGPAPATDDPDLSRVLTDAVAVLEEEIGHHYQFEEDHLFPRFAEAIDAGIPNMLRDEHSAIRPVARRMADLARGARAGGFSDAEWGEFVRLGGELIEREVFHIQKEEMGFLPALEQVIDPDDDGDLSMAYAELKGG